LLESVVSFICLSVVSLEKLWANLCEIFGRDRHWQKIKYLSNFGWDENYCYGGFLPLV